MTIQLQKPDYFVIYVSNMQRSTAFYRDVLGLPLKMHSPGWTAFNTGDIPLALHATEATSQGRAEGIPAGQAQLVFIVDDIQAAYEALKAQDVPFSMPPQKQATGRTFAILHDPDGFAITLQQR